MVFCTIEEAWGNNFINNNNNNNDNNYKNINYEDINYNNIDLDSKKKNIEKKNETTNINLSSKKGNKKKGGKKKGGINKKKPKLVNTKRKKIKGGGLISEDFDIFYYIIIGIVLVILIDTFYKLGKNN